MTRALNIKIQDAIYSQLDQHAREHNVTKTQIVEMALSQWFGGNVDEDVEDVDSSVDNVDVPSKTPKDNGHYIEPSNNSSNDIENIISTKVAEYLLGVTCPVPNVDKNVDGDVDSVDSSVDDDVDDDVDDENKDIELLPYTQSGLAKRLGVGDSTLHRWRSRTDFSEWSKARDPQGISWQYGKDKKYHQT